MSLVSDFEDQINNYVNQMTDYQDQVSQYKEQLVASAGQASEMAKQLATEIGVPVGLELAKLGVTKLFGQAAGDIVANVGGAAVRGALNGETSAGDVLANMRAGLTDTESPTEAADGALGDAVTSARSAVSAVVNRISGGAEDAAADALASAQEGLSTAVSNLASGVGQRVLGSIGNIVQAQGGRIAAAANENNIIGALNRTDTPLDNSIFGDFEMSNMADLNVKVNLPDLSLPNELTFEMPGIAEPMAFPGASSNIIGRLLSLRQQGTTEMEQAESLVPSAEDVTATVSQIGQGLLSRASGAAQGAIEGLSGQIGQVATEAATGATEAISGVAGAATEGAAGEAVAGVAGAAAEAGEAVAAGAAGGPAGLVIGGLIGLGTLLYGLFHHEHTQAAPPPVMPQLSLPSFQPGLGTME